MGCQPVRQEFGKPNDDGKTWVEFMVVEVYRSKE